ncbi:hypothetical protein MHIR_DE00173 [Candidatus Doolittlea endobia]|uniref:Uncharacterized protein n=1 Tax=Candidatus Doolittlea endobia TaxID=1778262 RepID=A0A143WRX9_9ENTR|nr:hypothetical protein MHIR_DE00173 [Candidatus Doolittlea endobia]
MVCVNNIILRAIFIYIVVNVPMLLVLFGVLGAYQLSERPSLPPGTIKADTFNYDFL